MKSLNESMRKTKADSPIYIDTGLLNAPVLTGTALFQCVANLKSDYKEIILLCIGTDRATGDSLGPLTGHKLSEKISGNTQIKLYGTLDKPVHATNLQGTVDEIYRLYEKPLIVAVDACLGITEHVGYLMIGTGGLSPGAAVNKAIPKVGDIYIAGIVNFSCEMDFLILQNTRLNTVMKMADVITGGITLGLGLIVAHKSSRIG